MDPVINHQAWEQLRLLPPGAITIEVRLYIDGSNETAQVAWKVSETDSDELMEIGIDHVHNIDAGLQEGCRVLSELWSKSRAALAPF